MKKRNQSYGQLVAKEYIEQQKASGTFRVNKARVKN